MISDRNAGLQWLILLCQCVLVTAAFWLWVPLCYHPPIDHGVVVRYLVYNEFILLGLLIISWRIPASLTFRTPGFEEASRRTLRQFRGALFFLLLYLVAAQDDRISRLFFFSFIPLLYLVLFAGNRFLPSLLSRFAFRRQSEQKVLLIGPRRKAAALKSWLDQNQHLGLQVLGLLTEDNDGVADPSLPTLGRPEDLEKLLPSPGVMQVIMAEFPRSNGSMQHYTDLCEERGVRLLVVADLDEIFGHPLAVFEDQGRLFIGLREEPLEDPVDRFFKRCLDIAVSLPVVIFVLPPLMLVAWIVQRLQSPGPLLHIQLREGFRNLPFRIYKLRTMDVGDPANEALPSSKRSPRLYPFGSLLRKTSLDEMPQFWNVLRGDMSVVGPRPHLAADNREWRQIYHRSYVRCFLKPGITGLAQVRGFRGMAKEPKEIVSRMESDIEYLENWSFLLDCRLILRTALQMFSPKKTAV